MPIDRAHFAEWFDRFPDWICGTCGKGVLAMVSPDERTSALPAYTQHGLNECYLDEEQAEWHFSARLTCTNPSCGEISIVIGDDSPVRGDHPIDEEDYVWDSRYRPRAFYPPPAPFKIDEACPAEVRTSLVAAFGHLWTDPSAAASRVRIAAEHLLDERKVKKVGKGKDGKRPKLNLHDRIVAFQKGHQQPAKLLMAIKYVGNNGAHSRNRELSRNDVLDGMELFEGVIELVYARRADRLSKLASTITKRKGRPSRAT